MTAPRDPDRLIDAFLAEGPDRLPDRTYDTVRGDINRTRQRVFIGPWRDVQMNTFAKLAIGLAAVVVVAIVGLNLLPGDRGAGGPAVPTATAGPTETAAPTATVAPSATPSAVYPSWMTEPGDGAGILSAGSQTTQRFLGGSTFTVPEGWVNDGDYAPVYTLFPDTPANQAEYALSKGTAQDITLTDRIQNNMGVICDATGLFQGTTASDVIDWVGANEAFSKTEPVEVTIGGLRGLQVDLRLSPDWTGSCPLGADDPPTRDFADYRGRFIALDTPAGGSIGIWIGTHYSADFEAFLADAMPIVESLQFDFAP